MAGSWQHFIKASVMPLQASFLQYRTCFVFMYCIYLPHSLHLSACASIQPSIHLSTNLPAFGLSEPCAFLLHFVFLPRGLLLFPLPLAASSWGRKGREWTGKQAGVWNVSAGQVTSSASSSTLVGCVFRSCLYWANLYYPHRFVPLLFMLSVSY